MRWVLSKGLAPAAIGASAGVAGSLALVHLLATLLFGVKTTDAMTFVAAPLALLCVAALGSYFPARRAASIDPMRALRSE
jgi:ABC-type antimicrobial peptide transport system permease subunit